MAMQIVNTFFLIAIPPFPGNPGGSYLPPGRGKLLLLVLLALAGNQEQHEHCASHSDHANDGEYHGAVITGLGQVEATGVDDGQRCLCVSAAVILQHGHTVAVNACVGGHQGVLHKKPCHRERICADIDLALSKHPDSLEALLKILEEYGYQIKRGKVPSILGEGQRRFIRMDSLGENYLPEAIKAVIAGHRPHVPRQKRRGIESTRPTASLLVDIQAKLKEGKGAGYVRWAKSFNLKQAAQTLIYLQENKLLEYADLESRMLSVTDRYHKLAAEIKSSEARMAEVKILQQHIINYSKTRSIYMAYRKAGYSKKFRQEHESDILLHQSAKKYFDELGLENLPTVKSLQSEYAELLSRKKEVYPEYRRLRAEMKELLTVKANVDQLLNMDISDIHEANRDKPR